MCVCVCVCVCACVCVCVCVQADQKLREEQRRAVKYLETRKGCNSVPLVCILNRLITSLPVTVNY